jgi:hypothetical protein
MPLPSGDRCHMSLGVHHVLDVHVTSDSCLEFLAIAAVDASLVVGAAAEEHGGVGVWGEA